MKFYIYFILFLSFSCKTLEKNRHSDAIFPTNYLGKWEGKLLISNSKGKDSVDMSLILSPINDSTFSWKIVYGLDTLKGLRNYQLIRKNTTTFIIDELNGIRLDAYFFHNKLVSRFSVMNNLLDCIYTFQKDTIVFEVLSGKEKSINSTGDTIFNMDTIPIVRNFALTNYQIAYLHRLK